MTCINTIADTATQTTIGPYADGTFCIVLTVVLSILLTVLLSGLIIKTLIGKSSSRQEDRSGWVMGKAENVIVVLFRLAGELTGIAILISAKAIVRKSTNSKDNPEEDTSYRVAGTLTNLAWSLSIGLLARVIIFGI